MVAGPARFCLAAALCLHLTTIASAQPAPDGAARTVTLKDGSIFRGELIELVPRDHLTIKLATGDIRRFEWSELSEAQSPPPPPAPVIAPPPPPVMPPPPALPMWPVHIDSDAPTATLYRENGIAPITGYAGGTYVTGTMHLYQPVCRAPCDEAVDRLGLFSIRGQGIAPSRDFSLPMSGPVRLDVHAWTNNKRYLGFAMIILGGLMTAGGAGLVAYSAVHDPLLFVNKPTMQQMQAAQSTRTAYTAGGGVLLGVGIPAFIAGMVLARLRSSVEIF